MRLDQFFTHKTAAARCWRTLRRVLAKLNGGGEDLFFVEPAAGDGVFYDLLPAERRLGIDIAPRRNEFVRADFLKRPLVLPHTPRRTVVVGNPPFGVRGKTAVEFFRRAAGMAETVAFIVPVIFRKYFIHKQLPKRWRWIFSEGLPRDSFWTPDGKNAVVNTEFQVWTTLPNKFSDMRLFVPPPIRHDDFQIWQYNNTREALKAFKEGFDFAVPCQGWQDYTRRETRARDCEKHKQWMLFAPANPLVHKRLHRGIDYAQLAMRNTTSVPGFRKGDIVQEYIRRYG